MADYSVNLYNSIDIFGAGPASLWGVAQGSVDNWGYGSVDMRQSVVKLIENTTTLSDETFLNASKLISNSLAMTDAMAEETLRDGQGYNYLFVSNKTDAEDRWQGTWTNQSVGDVATYTTSSGSSTNWTQL